MKVLKTPEVILPNHRLQYKKDGEGKYSALILESQSQGGCVSGGSTEVAEAMELVCELPGVQDMGCIARSTDWDAKIWKNK